MRKDIHLWLSQPPRSPIFVVWSWFHHFLCVFKVTARVCILWIIPEMTGRLWVKQARPWCFLLVILPIIWQISDSFNTQFVFSISINRSFSKDGGAFSNRIILVFCWHFKLKQTPKVCSYSSRFVILSACLTYSTTLRMGVGDPRCHCLD